SRKRIGGGGGGLPGDDRGVGNCGVLVWVWGGVVGGGGLTFAAGGGGRLPKRGSVGLVRGGPEGRRARFFLLLLVGDARLLLLEALCGSFFGLGSSALAHGLTPFLPGVETAVVPGDRAGEPFAEFGDGEGGNEIDADNEGGDGDQRGARLIEPIDQE